MGNHLWETHMLSFSSVGRFIRGEVLWRRDVPGGPWFLCRVFLRINFPLGRIFSFVSGAGCSERF